MAAARPEALSLISPFKPSSVYEPSTRYFGIRHLHFVFEILAHPEHICTKPLSDHVLLHRLSLRLRQPTKRRPDLIRPADSCTTIRPAFDADACQRNSVCTIVGVVAP